MRTAKSLIRLGRLESSLGTHICWFCHVAAHITLALLCDCALAFEGSLIVRCQGPFSHVMAHF